MSIYKEKGEVTSNKEISCYSKENTLIPCYQIDRYCVKTDPWVPAQNLMNQAEASNENLNQAEASKEKIESGRGFMGAGTKYRESCRSFPETS